jgi:DNA polymerase/3'-5' exonuclease PolX
MSKPFGSGPEGPKDYKPIIIENLIILKKKETINNEPYKVKAYEKVISQLEEFPGIIHNMQDLEDANIKGIGAKIKAKIEEIFDTGKLVAAEMAKESSELTLYDNLLEIYGVGPVKARELIDTYNVSSIADLRSKVEAYPDLLTKASKVGLQYYEELRQRIPRKEMQLHDTVVNSFLPDGLVAEIAGSYRRGLMTSGDIDVLVSIDPKNPSGLKSKTPKGLKDPKVKEQLLFLEYLEALEQEGYITDVLSLGANKCLAVSLINDIHRRIDFVYCPYNEFYYTLLYFTGSKLFNVAMRGHALKLGWSMSEHGLERIEDSKNAIGPEPKIPNSEKDIFDFLGLKFVEPKDRTGSESVIPI